MALEEAIEERYILKAQFGCNLFDRYIAHLELRLGIHEYGIGNDVACGVSTHALDSRT